MTLFSLEEFVHEENIVRAGKLQGLRTPYFPEAKAERDTELAGTGQECLPGISYLHPLTGFYMCYLEKMQICTTTLSAMCL